MSDKAKRQHEREVARLERQRAKLKAAELATDDAQRFTQYLQTIVGLHKDCIEEWDWHDINNAPQPPPPVLKKDREQAARAELETYKPDLLARIFGSGTKRVAELTAAINAAHASDERENAEVLNRYKEQVTTWDIERRLAKLVLAKNPDGYREVLNYADALAELGDFGSYASVTAAQPDLLVIRYAIADRVTVPMDELELSGSGKLLSKTMPVDRYWALYQRHVCSAALRIARDVFNVIPVRHIIVNVSRAGVNSLTGYRTSDTIVAVRFVRSILNQINLQTGEVSESIKAFQPRMKFTDSVGFEPVEPLTPS